MSAATGLQLSARQKRLIRISFESFNEYSESAVLLFYGRLFELNPSLRGLFHIEIRVQARKLLDVTMETLAIALKNSKPGRRWTDIARLMQHHVESNGFSVVREFVGHGIGRSMHEDPKVANFVTAEQLRGDFKLRPGMTLAVEPMVVMGRRDVDLLSDNWTVVTKDHKPAAHFEHTVAITETGVDILTDGRPPIGL